MRLRRCIGADPIVRQGNSSLWTGNRSQRVEEPATSRWPGFGVRYDCSPWPEREASSAFAVYPPLGAGSAHFATDFSSRSAGPACLSRRSRASHRREPPSAELRCNPNGAAARSLASLRRGACWRRWRAHGREAVSDDGLSPHRAELAFGDACLLASARSSNFPLCPRRRSASGRRQQTHGGDDGE